MLELKGRPRARMRAALRGTLLCVWVGGAAANTLPPLEVGIFPYLSPRALLAQHAPMKEYLEAQLGRPLNLSTASSFRDIFERTRSGEYGLVILPPHLARLAQVEAGYVPVAVYSKALKGVIAVRRDSPYRKARDLAGKHIVAPDRVAIVTFIGVQYLREQGLQAGANYTLSTSTSHSSAAYSVIQKEFDAVITERAAFEKQIPDDVRANLRVLATMGNTPHVMFLAHPRLGKEQIERLRELLPKFANETPEGRQFIEKSGFEGIRAVTEADLRALDVYLPELRRMLEQIP
jgi:phosphonate transport system substrate-binding protein